MLDIKELEAQAAAELAEETGKSTKAKIKTSLQRIQQAEKVLANLKAEHEVLLRDISA